MDVQNKNGRNFIRVLATQAVTNIWNIKITTSLIGTDKVNINQSSINSFFQTVVQFEQETEET